MTRIGMVHTVPGFAERFEHDAKALRPDLEIVHVADPALLQACIDGRETHIVQDELQRTVAYLLSTCSAALVTCSSLGGMTDAIARDQGWPLHRIDRPMAERAAALAGTSGTVSVLATLTSTLEPTMQLLAEILAPGVTVNATLVDGAYDAIRRGESADHLIRDAVGAVLETSDAVVLAQASMANAVKDTSTEKILTSPESGLAAFLSNPHTHVKETASP